MAADALAIIMGAGLVGPQREVPGPLDELIFRATSEALSNAGLTLPDINGIYMASSDVYDGRAISTMTLTASTGSLGKHEMKVCDDGLGALALATAGLRSNVVDRALVTAWSKLSDADLATIDPLGAEPAFHRPLGLSSQAVRSLQRSHAEGEVTTVGAPAEGGDVAVCLVVGLTDDTAGGVRGALLGTGWSSGAYLQPDDGWLEPLGEAVALALKEARLDVSGITTIRSTGFLDIEDDRLRRAIDVDAPIVRAGPDDYEVGYAGGLLGVMDALDDAGTSLVVSRAGLGTDRTYAAVIEGRR